MGPPIDAHTHARTHVHTLAVHAHSLTNIIAVVQVLWRVSWLALCDKWAGNYRTHWSFFEAGMKHHRVVASLNMSWQRLEITITFNFLRHHADHYFNIWCPWLWRLACLGITCKGLWWSSLEGRNKGTRNFHKILIHVCGFCRTRTAVVEELHILVQAIAMQQDTQADKAGSECLQLVQVPMKEAGPLTTSCMDAVQDICESSRCAEGVIVWKK